MKKTDYLDSPTFCILPWIHACVRTDESLKPCCRYQYEEDDSSTVDMNDIKKLGADAFNEKYLKKLRQDMLDGVKRVECTKCYQQEVATKGISDRTSLRLFLNERFAAEMVDTYTNKFDKVRYIEMSVDNVCNLECKMCDSKFSSKLQLRDKHLGKTAHKKLEPSFEKFNDTDLSSLVYVKILGGEPFITPNFAKFIDWLETKVNLENVAIEIATNATKLPNQKLIAKLSKFNAMYINVSLDVMDKANDYQRFGSDYKEVFTNAQKYEELFGNAHVAFHSTISTLTANKLATSLDQLIQLHKYHVSVDFVRDPEHLSLLYAPRTLINWVLEKNKGNSTAFKLLNTFVKGNKYDKQKWNEFIETSKKLDIFYKTNLEEYNPELANHLKENNYGF